MKKSTIAVLIALILAGSGFGGWRYYEGQIAAMQDAGVESLMLSVNTDEYREAEQNEIIGILKDTEAKIRESRDEDEIKGMVQDAASKFAEFKTKAQYNVDEGVTELKALVNLDDYREAEQAEIKKILEDTEAKIKDSKDESEIDALVKKASAGFAEFKTDAQYAEEEAAAAAAAAAAARASSSKSKKSGGSGGCVGGGSDVFN